jgi:hypothetical protein
MVARLASTRGHSLNLGSVRLLRLNLICLLYQESYLEISSASNYISTFISTKVVGPNNTR